MRVLSVVVLAAIGLALAPACSLLVDTSGLAGPDVVNALDGLEPDGASNANDAKAKANAPLAEPLPCDPKESPGDGVFASEHGEESAPGTRELPFKTIASALALASSARKSVVYLEEGTYREALALSAADAGITLSAGWLRSGGAWTRDCTDNVAGRTTLASPGSVGLRVTAASREIVIERLTITTKPAGSSAPEQSGESVFGLIVDASSIRLRGAVIEAGAAGAGGFVPDRPIGHNQTCDGTTSCDTGQPGTPALQAAPATASGTFDDHGYLPSDGATGGPGLPGENGGPGGLTPTPCGACAGGSKCTVANNCIHMPASNFTQGRGRCGCGGEGGAPGGPGSGGGASLAIFVIGGEVTLEHATVRAGAGGNGSPGGGGGAGGPGTPGLIGNAIGQSCQSACIPVPSVGLGCSCLAAAKPIAGGAPGGAGGAGGAGAKGGGGAGGPSHAIVTSKGAKIMRDNKSILVPASAGKGAGGAPDGVSSESRAL